MCTADKDVGRSTAWKMHASSLDPLNFIVLLLYRTFVVGILWIKVVDISDQSK